MTIFLQNHLMMRVQNQRRYNVENASTILTNLIVEDLKKKGFNDEDIKMAAEKAKKHYETFFGKPKKKKEVDEDDEDYCFY